MGNGTEIITSFLLRLNKIGIKIELSSNVPWIYLDKVNGKKVKTRLDADHGFTAFWYPVRIGEKVKVNDIGKLFKEIRKHL